MRNKRVCLIIPVAVQLRVCTLLNDKRRNCSGRLNLMVGAAHIRGGLIRESIN